MFRIERRTTRLKAVATITASNQVIRADHRHGEQALQADRVTTISRALPEMRIVRSTLPQYKATNRITTVIVTIKVQAHVACVSAVLIVVPLVPVCSIGSLTIQLPIPTVIWALACKF